MCCPLCRAARPVDCVRAGRAFFPMPKCIICQSPIRVRRDRHSHALVGNRKVYACAGCTEAFDAYLDAHCPQCGSDEWHEKCDACGYKGGKRKP